MGYYRAWGDAKMIYSSEEEGYENHASGGREKRSRVSGTFGEALSAPTSSALDDTDRQFWAEDELSNSESRQKLMARRKRRHSLSYRNRTSNRSRSPVSHSSTSNSDSMRAVASPKIRKVRRNSRCQSKPTTEKLQSVNTRKRSSTDETNSTKDNTNRTSCSMKRLVTSEYQTVPTTEQRSSHSHLDSHPAILSRNNHRARVDDAIRGVRNVRLRKMCGPFKSKRK